MEATDRRAVLPPRTTNSSRHRANPAGAQIIFVFRRSCGRVLPVKHMMRALCAFYLLLTSSLFAQTCSTNAVVDPFDARTTQGISGLKLESFEAKAANLTLPIISVKEGFNSRVLVLLQVGNDPEQQAMQTEARRIADIVRNAPAGRPIAFGIFAEKAFISREFATDPKKRAAAVDEILSHVTELRGKTSAVYDTLHEAITAFGPHRPADTILLMGDGVDHSSKRNPSDLEKELLFSGTRLLVVIERDITPMVANTMAGIHVRQVAPGLKFLSSVSGGAFRYTQAGQFLDFASAGYLLEIQIPSTWDKPKEWQVRVKDASGKLNKNVFFYAPLKLAPCGTTTSTAAR
jgi:hypothetical protein